jgi:hypothetical protein
LIGAAGYVNLFSGKARLIDEADAFSSPFERFDHVNRFYFNPFHHGGTEFTENGGLHGEKR